MNAFQVRLSQAETEELFFELKRWIEKPDEIRSKAERGFYIIWKILRIMPYKIMKEHISYEIFEGLDRMFNLKELDRPGYTNGERRSPDED